MPKKGETLDYRVVYQFPSQVENRVAFRTINEAQREAGAIGRRGGNSRVLWLTGGQEYVLATFGPDVIHRFTLLRPRYPEAGLACLCGYVATVEDAADTHMICTGLCSVCEGTGLVAERVVRDGAPEPGDMIRCPICQGSGKEDDVSFWDVEMDTFYDRRAALWAKASNS